MWISGLKGLKGVNDVQAEPRFKDNRLIRTPHYYGQFSLFLG